MTHIKALHKGIKYPCDQCDFKATQKSNLLTHIKSIHECVKYPCEQCEHKAASKHNLLTHIISKHDQVRFPCDQCDYNATFKSSLLAHIKRKHLSTGNQATYPKQGVKKDLTYRIDDNRRCEIEEEGMEQRTIKLCPISSCTFSLNEKNRILELNHLKRNHPHVDNQTSFLLVKS